MNKFTQLAVVLCSLMFIVGCAGPQPRLATFNESEYAPYFQNGTAVVTGQAFLKTRSGDVKYGAGNEVTLTPVTSYSSEWWNRTIVRGVKLLPPDPRAKEGRRSTVADGEGRFTFDNLPAGDYFALCVITWEVPVEGIEVSTGGIAGARVHVDDDGRLNVILLPVRGI